MISAPRDIFGPNVFRIFVKEFGGAKKVAKFLDVGERTVHRWLSEERVPRMAVLALYWETQYGRSMVHSDQVNEIRLMYRQICILQEQYAKAREIVASVRKLHTGSANEPFVDELGAGYSVQPHSYQMPAWAAQF
ncbi:hypothetical protein [Variovorax sp. HJSM1_2]|uniref:hypothetical protein n=1 Tax=Variovorax sp. HJSM1_2 TaxID=3366263 RepID=UPI003BBF604C